MYVNKYGEGKMTEKPFEMDLLPLVEQFVPRRKADLLEIQKLAQQEDYLGISKICHRSKGVAVPLGFPTFAEIAGNLEEACCNNNRVAIEISILQMEQYLASF